jgi:hypothetical protein
MYEPCASCGSATVRVAANVAACPSCDLAQVHAAPAVA